MLLTFLPRLKIEPKVFFETDCLWQRFGFVTMIVAFDTRPNESETQLFRLVKVRTEEGGINSPRHV